MIAEPVSIKPGTPITFMDQGAETSGIVNGEPWLYWETDELAVYVPCHISASNRNVIVSGANILGAS